MAKEQLFFVEISPYKYKYTVTNTNTNTNTKIPKHQIAFRIQALRTGYHHRRIWLPGNDHTINIGPL